MIVSFFFPTVIAVTHKIVDLVYDDIVDFKSQYQKNKLHLPFTTSS